METQADKIQDMVIEVAMSIFIFYYFFIEIRNYTFKMRFLN